MGEIQIVVYLVAAIVFLRWFYRAYANLNGVGVEGPRHGSGWTIWYGDDPITVFPAAEEFFHPGDAASYKGATE